MATVRIIDDPKIVCGTLPQKQNFEQKRSEVLQNVTDIVLRERRSLLKIIFSFPLRMEMNFLDTLKENLALFGRASKQFVFTPSFLLHSTLWGVCEARNEDKSSGLPSSFPPFDLRFLSVRSRLPLFGRARSSFDLLQFSFPRSRNSV